MLGSLPATSLDDSVTPTIASCGGPRLAPRFKDGDLAGALPYFDGVAVRQGF
jgi:hypothetical protein